MMDPTEVFRRILEHDQEQEAPRDFDAEVALLRQIEELRSKEHKFTPGQIIRHRYPKQAAISNADAPAIFVRYLPEPVAGSDKMALDDFGSNSAAMVLDFEFACITHGLRTSFLSNSRDWEPHPDYQPVLN